MALTLSPRDENNLKVLREGCLKVVTYDPVKYVIGTWRIRMNYVDQTIDGANIAKFIEEEKNKIGWQLEKQCEYKGKNNVQWRHKATVERTRPRERWTDDILNDFRITGGGQTERNRVLRQGSELQSHSNKKRKGEIARIKERGNICIPVYNRKSFCY